MHTLSSASRTCMASASAVECTATVGMPSSLHARSTRSAISPRLAMRIFSNIFAAYACLRQALSDTGVARCSGPGHSWSAARSFDDHQRLAELDRLAVLDENLRHGAGARGGDLVHRLHRFD